MFSINPRRSLTKLVLSSQRPHPSGPKSPPTTSNSINQFITRRHASTLLEPQYNQTLTLPSGRTLGFAEFGVPNGRPLLFFHGFPTSRLEAFGFDAIARRRRLRIIAPDRPGFGLSTFQPGRRITDWPADVQALAKHVGLRRFALLGGSGGGPYALACARVMPPGMLSAVGILSGAPPWWAGAKEMPFGAKLASVLANYWPSGLAGMTGGLVGLFKLMLTNEAGKKAMQMKLEQLSTQMRKEKGIAEEAKKEVSFTPERVERTMRVWFEGFAQGPDAFVQEAQLLTAGDWGFRFEDVKYDPIKMWHGTKDRNSPISMIRYMAGQLPHGALRELEGESHFSVSTHIEEILSDFIDDKTLAGLGKRDVKR